MEFFTRFLRPDDAESLLSLNRELAAIPHGFVRNEEEMNLEFVEKTIERGVNGGIALGAFERGSGRLMGAITSRQLALKAFEHVISNVTVGVHPDFQQKGVARRLLLDLLENVQMNREDITRVELIARESNQRQIAFYESIGFRREGVFEKRIRNPDGSYEADIPMGWTKHE
ncbi:MAG: N-acetyltransferase [Proteobacteria bacterium]|nr:MAG: N-acetyltransferase [Pseudomonadota bacterium]